MLKLGKLLRARGMASKGQLVEILRVNRRDRKAAVRPLNSIDELEVALSILRPYKPPERNIAVRMAKEAEFDQDCGCTAVVEIRKQSAEAFNVYGDFEEYLASRVRRGLDLTPHHRRRHLKEKGFVRSKGKKSKVRDHRRRVRKYERDGYDVVEE